MKPHAVRIRPLIAAVAGVVVLASASTSAAVTIQASFAPIRITAQAGAVITKTYELKLQEGEPAAQFKVAVEDWWRSEDGQQSFYAPAGSLERSCGQWVTVNPKESTVSGGQSLQVRLTISVPANVKAGGYWCALSIDELPNPLAVTPDGVGVKFLASVSTGLYVNVNPIEKDADIVSVDIVEGRAVARLLNTGNAPLTVEGRYEFLRPGARTPTAVVELSRNILLTEPTRSGCYSVALPDRDELPGGRYLVRLIIDIGVDHYIAVQRELDIRRDDEPRDSTPH